jgi:Na+-transporting methylmalonyl-CoA/oxaloacetate decarboxylase gamma subunit
MTFAGVDQATLVAVVAQPPPTTEQDPGRQGEDFGKSSPVGLLVVLLLLVAVAFLIRSMTKHLKRVPASFDEPSPAPDSPREPETAPPANGDRKDAEGKD